MVTSNGQPTCSYSGLCSPAAPESGSGSGKWYPASPTTVSELSISEDDPIPLLTYNVHDIFISDKQNLNGGYVEFALLLEQNFSSTRSVSGTLAIINNQLSIKPATSKIKQPINSIEMWSDAFINFILVYIQKHIAKASDLLKYMVVIRGRGGGRGGCC